MRVGSRGVGVETFEVRIDSWMLVAEAAVVVVVAAGEEATAGCTLVPARPRGEGPVVAGRYSGYLMSQAARRSPC